MKLNVFVFEVDRGRGLQRKYHDVFSNAKLELIFGIIHGINILLCIKNSNPGVVSIIQYINNILCDYLAIFSFILKCLNVAEKHI